MPSTRTPTLAVNSSGSSQPSPGSTTAAAPTLVMKQQKYWREFFCDPQCGAAQRTVRCWRWGQSGKFLRARRSLWTILGIKASSLRHNRDWGNDITETEHNKHDRSLTPLQAPPGHLGLWLLLWWLCWWYRGGHQELSSEAQNENEGKTLCRRFQAGLQTALPQTEIGRENEN